MRFLWIIVLSVVACTGKKTAKVETISMPEMTKILWDIIQVDEFASDFVHRDTTKDLDKERKILYLKVFDLHKVSREQFTTSYKYYAARPDDLKVIFDSLGERGVRERKYIYMPKDSLSRTLVH